MSLPNNTTTNSRSRQDNNRSESYFNGFVRSIRTIILRPSIWICGISIIAYWDPIALRGSYVYDDAGSVKHNVVVNGQVPWTEAFTRDYWGTIMTQPQSHKSFRPITTLSFKLNYVYYQYYQEQKNKSTTTTINPTNDETYGFHVVNVILHGLVTLLVTEVAYYVFTLYPTTTNWTNRQRTNVQQSSLRIIVPVVITGLVFGLHPVHAEAVSNITSRGELLMSFFTLLGFLAYVRSIPKYDTNHHPVSFYQRLATITGLFIVPCLCMILSLFSKEQGATTLLSIVCYDFIIHYFSVYEYFSILYRIMTKRRNSIQLNQPTNRDRDHDVNIQNQHEEKQQTSENETTEEWHLVQFTLRAIILLLQTIIIAGFRFYLNGETTPDFIYDQNPAGFATERLTRILSIPYIYCLYVYDIVVPNRLCPDWSGLSIILVTSFRDNRCIFVILLWIVSFIFFYSLVFGVRKKQYQATTTVGSNQKRYYIRQVALISFFSFTFSPFLLSSNLLVVVGLMKADRVIYLPLLGFCLLQGLVYQIGITSMTTAATTKNSTVINLNNGETRGSNPGGNHVSSASTSNQTFTGGKSLLRKRIVTWALYVLFMVQMTYYTAKLHERNIAWSSSLRLWMSAYAINQRSHHTIYNCGYELSLQQRYREAEYVLRPIGDPHVAGPSNTFVYAMVLYNLKRCPEAFTYIEKAFRVIADKEQHLDDTPRNTNSSLQRVKSNLMVAKAYCTIPINIKVAGSLMYKAVQLDPTNQYAIDQATMMVERIDSLKIT